MPKDATSLELETFQKAVKTYFSKGQIYKAILDNDIIAQREISNYFFKINGIYSRVCALFGYMYRLDWYLATERHNEKTPLEKIKKETKDMLTYLDNSYIAKVFSDISLNTVINGAYYGYIVKNPNKLIL